MEAGTTMLCPWIKDHRIALNITFSKEQEDEKRTGLLTIWLKLDTGTPQNIHVHILNTTFEQFFFFTNILKIY